MNNAQQYENEIGLIDLVSILLKRKYIILIIFIAVLLASIFCLLGKETIYESRAVVAIGSYGNDNALIEKASSMKRRLISSYQMDEPDYQNIKKYPYPKLISVNVERDSEDFISIVSQAYSPERAQLYLQAEVDEIIAGHQKKFSAVMSTQIELLESQTKLINSMTDEVNNFGKLVDQVNKEDSTQAVLLKIEQLKFNENLPRMNISISQLSFKIEGAKETQIIKAPVLNDKPVKPKKMLILMVGSLLGLFAGIFMVFFIEFFVAIKKQLAQTSN